jgi:DNA invertase Pin-like site-specific DNA recombinase
MICAALYARDSSEGQREASIGDQYRNCEEYAARQGSRTIARYQDQALSGTIDERQRPGFKKLLDDARAKRFEILPLDDLSRLSCDSAKAEELRRQFVELDPLVRIVRRQCVGANAVENSVDPRR